MSSSSSFSFPFRCNDQALWSGHWQTQWTSKWEDKTRPWQITRVWIWLPLIEKQAICIWPQMKTFRGGQRRRRHCHFQQQKQRFGPGNFLSHHRKSISIYYLHCTNELNGVNGDVLLATAPAREPTGNGRNWTQCFCCTPVAQSTYSVLWSVSCSTTAVAWQCQFGNYKTISALCLSSY